MSKLTLDSDQTTVLQQIYADLEDAFYFGIDVAGTDINLDMGPSTPYDDDSKMGAAPGISATQLRDMTKQGIIRFLAAAVKRVPGLTAGITTTVTLAKITGGGSNGSLTFVSGVLTAKVDPT